MQGLKVFTLCYDGSVGGSHFRVFVPGQRVTHDRNGCLLSQARRYLSLPLGASG